MKFVYFLKHKPVVDLRVCEFVANVERQTESNVKRLRFDNDGHYGSNALNDYLKQWEISIEKTEPYKPQQNRNAERTNSISMDKAGLMMQCTEGPNRFWAANEATATNFRNLTSSAVLNWQITREKWDSKNPNVTHLKTFGCRAEAYVAKDRRANLDAGSRECSFFEYTNTWQNYCFYDVSKGKIVVCSNAKFYELEKILNTSNNYSYGTSVFDTQLYEENGNRADQTQIIVEKNTHLETYIDSRDIDNKNNFVSTDDTPPQPLVWRSGQIRQ